VRLLNFSRKRQYGSAPNFFRTLVHYNLHRKALHPTFEATPIIAEERSTQSIIRFVELQQFN